MSRKKKHEEHENHERWLVSYADFITLLFAFFVVMYSISSVNEGKYRVLSESMSAAFRSSARTMEPIQIGQLSRSPLRPLESIVDQPKPMEFKPIVIESAFITEPSQSEVYANDGWQLDAAAAQVDAIADEVEAAMQALIEQGLVSIRRNRLWLEVELNTSFLFTSGKALPSIDAEFILLQLARVLKDQTNRLHVEGFTDNEPISNSIYPSNWELSAARAAAVVRLFAGFGIAPERMAAIGHGEFRPVASNATEAGRNQNRRVVIVILANLYKEGEEVSVSDFELLRQKLQFTPAKVD